MLGKLSRGPISNFFRPLPILRPAASCRFAVTQPVPEKELLSEKYASQFMRVLRILNERKAFSRELIEAQALTYYNHLGLHEYYFQTASPHTIANNLECVIAAQVLKSAASDSEFFPLFQQESDGEVFFLTKASIRNRQASQNFAVEKQLEDKYFGFEGDKLPYRMQCYRSVGSIFDNPEDYLERLRTYFLQKPEYPVPLEEVDPNETDLNKILDVYFYTNKQGTVTEEVYSQLNKQVVEDTTGRHIFFNSRKRLEGGYRLDFAFRRGKHTKQFFSRLGDCITMWGFYSQRKYMEPLANGVSIISTFVELLPSQELIFPDMPLEQRINRLIKSIKMQYIVEPVFTDFATERLLSIHEAAYCQCAFKFLQHFSSTVGPAFSSLEKVLKSGNNNISSSSLISPQELYEVRSRLKLSPFSYDSVIRAVADHPHIVKRLYIEFQQLLHPRLYKENNSQLTTFEHSNSLSTDILSLDSPEAANVFTYFRLFNKSILKTNFWKDDKLCLSFRLDPSFLPSSDYPKTPFAIMLFVGLEFTGFHVRFADVARGGIRVIPSYTHQTFEDNQKSAFDENYRLASTQHFKNKDIPEGGSKGVVLLNKTSNFEETEALIRAGFMSYIDGMLDLLLPNERVVDRYGKPEILFLGPDENTGRGELMDWAAQYARSRGAWFWKAFTTGKLPNMGGIPHDLFGMTTASVETYIRGIFEKMNLKEEEVTKLLIGGPDGDLGSNSMLRSRTKTTSVVDGSGVVHDPEGLNIDELKRLANRRFEGLETTACDYNKSYLSPKGFIVHQNDRNKTLPDGTIIPSGFQFRNEFHLNPLAKADLFNPCGGRPSSITPFNFHRLLDSDNKPHFKYIVEGANVFITDDARRMLENKGCVLFKDASTNKGGVTSSSHEVLAALALDDEQFIEHMLQQSDGTFPQFYQKYVQQIIQRVEENAKLEFNALWNEGEKSPIYRTDLSDLLSKKIIDLKSQILISDALWAQEDLVSNVLHKALLTELMPGLLTLETIRSRVPQSYLKSIFACFLSSRYYYSTNFSQDDSAFTFFDYINKLKYEK